MIASLGLFLVAVALYGWQANDSKYPTASGLLVALPMIGIGVLSAQRIGRHDQSNDIFGIVLCGLGLRMIGAFFRSFFAVDSSVYHRLATDQGTRAILSGNIFYDPGAPVPGTGAIRWLTALIEVGTFGNRFATFEVFTLISFLGACLFYSAFRLALPDSDHKRYAILVFLWPSLSFWPSSIGKEAVMLLALGVCSLAVAMLLRGRSFAGMMLLVAGAVASGFVRPHVTIIVLGGLFCALLVSRGARLRQGTNLDRVSFGAKLVLIPVLLLGAAMLAGETASRLRIDAEGTEQIAVGLSSTEAQTTQGGSAFRPATVGSPLDFPWAVVTVLYRPFPIEAHNTDALVAAVEGSLLLALTLLSTGRLLRVPSMVRSRPYVMYSLAFVAVFIFAFSAIGNFGILARQRSQVLPLFFVLLCASPSLRALTDQRLRARSSDRSEGATHEAPPITGPGS